MTTPWLMQFNKNKNGRLRLFFFPHAGSGSSAFRQWSRVLPPSIDSYAIQLPGRETRFREQSYQQVQPLVQDLANALLPYLDKPFVFWGHSMGALLSFEVARILQQRGLPTPQRLLVSGYNAPQIPYADPYLHQLPQAEFISALQELGGISEAVLQDTELRNLLLPIIRSDFQLVETYEYRDSKALHCPITILDGTADEKTNESDLKEWQKQSTMPLERFDFVGDHFFLYDLQPPIVNTVTQIINRQLLFIQGESYANRIHNTAIR